MKLKKYYTLMKLFIALALILLAAGCGTDGSVSSGSGSGSADTGAITAKLDWSSVTSAETAKLASSDGTSAKISIAASISSAPAGVVTVRIIVSGADMADVPKDFAAAAGQGTVDNIPAGSGRTIAAQGLDASGNVIAKGAISNITIVAGQTTDAGTITMLLPPTPPSTPTGFAVSASSSSHIDLSWGASTGATDYKIYKGGTYLKSVTTTSTSDTGLSPSTNYCYTVTAYNSAGESAQTSQQCATTQSPAIVPPSTPTGFEVSASSSIQIDLSWNASTGATEYKIYKGGTYLKSVTTTSSSDTGLSPSTNYCYTVSSNNSAGESPQTSQQCATTQSPTILPPSTPTGFGFTTVSSSQINLSWDAATGATGYKIYKDGTYLKSVTTTSSSDTGLSPSTNYCYTVSAYNSAGESPQTSQQCATTQAPVPGGMVLIPAGTFLMGDAVDSTSTELPVHSVTVSAFYLDKYEMTKSLWDEVYTWATANGYGFDNAGAGMAANHPVHTVSWYDVIKWLNARSEKEGRIPVYYTDVAQTIIYRTGQVAVANGAVKAATNGYRLPTEAEWEYAARGGTTTRYYTGSCISSDTQANYDGRTAYYGCPTGQYRGGTTVGGSFPENLRGLCDMAGNVWEWTWDWYGSYPVGTGGPVTNPQGPASGSDRVYRGGSWSNGANLLRSAGRNGGTPSLTSILMGFRSAHSQP